MLGMLLTKSKLLSMHFYVDCALKRLLPNLACSCTINITIHRLDLLLNHSHTFFDSFVLLHWDGTDKKCSINITYLDFSKFALE